MPRQKKQQQATRRARVSQQATLAAHQQVQATQAARQQVQATGQVQQLVESVVEEAAVCHHEGQRRQVWKTEGIPVPAEKEKHARRSKHDVRLVLDEKPDRSTYILWCWVGSQERHTQWTEGLVYEGRLIEC